MSDVRVVFSKWAGDHIGSTTRSGSATTCMVSGSASRPGSEFRTGWDGSTLHLVDLDLDVVKGHTGRVCVGDEDEFADHRLRFDYPDDVVRMAVSTCDDVRRGASRGRVRGRAVRRTHKCPLAR